MASETLNIPDKQRFKIGEVADLLDLEPYVLRYWETEFDVLAPDKTDSGQRVYRPDDIELVHTIKDLLYNEMFTIAGARRQLQRSREGKQSMLDSTPTGEGADQLDELRERIVELEEANEQLERKAHEAVERERELAAANEDLREQLGELEDVDSEIVSELEEQVDRLQTELHDAQKSVAELRDERDELRKRIDGHATVPTEKVDAVRREIQNLRNSTLAH